MIDRLKSIEASHAELTARLALPEVLADLKALRDTSKALAEIDPIVELYRRHRAVERELVQAREMAAAPGSSSENEYEYCMLSTSHRAPG